MLKTNTLGALAAAAGALVAVGLVMLIVLVVEVQPAEATFPGKNGNIAYSSLDGTDFEIYTIPTTGGTPTRLTNNGADDSRPAYSPEGTKIAFISDWDGNEEIYVMNAADGDGDGNGDNPTRLTSNAATDRYPDWGSHSDTTPPKVMTTSPANNATGVARTTNVIATFSEDMKESSISGQTFELVKLNADGTTRITAAVSYVAITKKAKLNPATSLTLGATYKATVTSGAQDLAGNALDQNPNIEGNQNKSWKFTVQ